MIPVIQLRQVLIVLFDLFDPGGVQRTAASLFSGPAPFAVPGHQLADIAVAANERMRGMSSERGTSRD